MPLPQQNPVANRIKQRQETINQKLAKIKHKIAVLSGKGGVGKTTVTINLAAMLLEKGKVGIIDADIDCPNVNKFLEINEKFRIEQETLFPIEKFGLKVISMASLQEAEDTPIMWRGPLIANTLLEFLEKTQWGEIDYLLIDMPPGTSDTSLTVMQQLEISGVIIVSTPQAVSLIDAKKSINMAKSFGVKILGLVENMSGEVFGKNTVQKLATETDAPFLGSIELSKKITELTEQGKIPAIEDAKAKKEFETIMQNLQKNLQRLCGFFS